MGDIYFGTTPYLYVSRNESLCHEAPEEFYVEDKPMLVYCIIFVIAMISSIMNMICVYIFARIKASQKSESSMNTSLLCLSVFEMLFGLTSGFYSLGANIIGLNINYSRDYISEFGYPISLYVMPVVFSITRCLIDFSLGSRNYITCLVTMARAEVIYWPLTNKAYQTLLRKSITFLVILMSISAVVFILAVIRQLDMYSVLCYYKKFEAFGYSEYRYISSSPLLHFICLTGLPWFLICIFSVIILVRLKQSQNITGHTQANESGQNKMVEARKSNQAKATRMIVTVALVFTVTEFPSIILSILDFSQVQVPAWTIVASNMLVQIDSMFNLIIFLVTLPVFRKFFGVCCKSEKQNTTTNASANNTTTKVTNVK